MIIINTAEELEVGKIYKGYIWDHKGQRHDNKGMMVLEKSNEEEFIKWVAEEYPGHVIYTPYPNIKFYKISID